MSEISTLADLPFHVSGRFPKPALIGRCHAEGCRALSSSEFFEQVRDISLGLTALGLQPGDRVAIVSESRPEWTLADLAILTAGAVTVPIYPTLASAQVGYILADSGARFAIVSDEGQVAKIREVQSQVPALATVAVVDLSASGRPTSEARSAADGFLCSLADIAARGHQRLVVEDGVERRYQERAAAVRPDDLATIIYTSGTTGDPKGVMLSHHNLVSNILATQQVLETTQEDVALSFLPLSHSFERLVVLKYLYTGVTVIFAESSETLGRDLQTVRPTVMTGVPRVYEKMRARVHETVARAPAMRRWLFAWALQVGVARTRAWLRGSSISPLLRLQDRLADRLVFAKVRARTGGRLRHMVSGAAPLPRDVAEFFWVVRIPLVEGYGLTESSPVLTVNPPDAPRLGTVGRAIPGVDIRVAEDGEILARGPNIMRGYYNRPGDTAVATRDGWLHTGDVGQLDADGYLTITDRKKDLIVTSGGKNVAPQPIENRLKGDPLVAEAILLGDRRRFVAALILPNFTALQTKLRERGHPSLDRGEMLQRPETKELYQQIVSRVNHDLAPFEQVKQFALLPAEFSVDGGELTPTMKVRRRVIETRYRDVIERMYAQP